jgi:tetratricopeptide (TPR) repeat protein
MQGRAALIFVALFLLLTGCQGLGAFRAANPPDADLSPKEIRQADAWASYVLAFLAEADNRPEAAVSHFQQASDGDPGYTPLTLQLAALYVMEKNFERARPLLERAVRERPPPLPALILLGHVYFATGETSKALKTFRRVIREAPHQAEGYVKAAAIELDRSRLSTAFDLLDTGLDKVHDPIPILQVYEALGKALLEQNRIPEALHCFQQIENNQPENLAVKEILATLHNLRAEPQKARAEWETILNRQPDNPLAHLRLGEILEAAGDFAGAEKHYRAACAHTPPTAEAYLVLAALFLKTNPPAAAPILTEGLQRLPKNPALNTFRGLLEIQFGHPARAREAFAAAEQGFDQIQPEFRKGFLQTFYFWYAVATERDGDIDRATELFEKHLALAPDNPIALNYLAYLWADRNIRLDTALDYANRALKTEPKNAAFLDTRGWIHFRAGRFPNALKDIQRAWNLMPGDPTVADHLGDVLHALNRETEAIRYWKKSFEADPQNNIVRQKLNSRGIPLPSRQGDL